MAGPVTFRRLRALVAVLALVGSAAGIAACSTELDASPPRSAAVPDAEIDVEVDVDVDGTAVGAADIDRVVMIGDSITRGSRPALEAQFAALGLGAEIEAQDGKRMVMSSGGNLGGARVAGELAASPERAPGRELWVVALGTNDIGQYAAPADIAAAVNEVLAAVPDGAPLIWVDTYFRDRPGETGELNAIVHERVARRGNAVIAPWAFFAPTDGVLTGDGVHPTSAGAEVFAVVVADTAATFLAR